jgi:hypothetical protein
MMYTLKPSSLLWGGRTNAVIASALACRHLHGAFVELGVGKAETARNLAVVAAQFNKKLLLVDSFTSSLPTTAVDGQYAKDNAHCFADIDIARRNLEGFSNVYLFDMLLQDYSNPTPWAFVHVDVDLYESTTHAVQLVNKYLVRDGIAVIDDYKDKTWPGVELACEHLEGFVSYYIEDSKQLLAVKI